MGESKEVLIYSIPTVEDCRGNLSYVQKGVIPFTPSGVSVGVNLPVQGIIIPLKGSVKVGSEVVSSPQLGADYEPHGSVNLLSGAVPLFLFEKKEVKYESLYRWNEVEVDPDCIEAPFDIKRIFYITEIPAMVSRGGHSHFRQQTLIIAIRGGMRVICDDGEGRKEFVLDRPTKALYLKPEVWREMDSFIEDTIVLTLTSTEYDPSDYIYDYELFRRLKSRRKK